MCKDEKVTKWEGDILSYKESLVKEVEMEKKKKNK